MLPITTTLNRIKFGMDYTLNKCWILLLILCVAGCGQRQTAQVSGVVKYADGSDIEGAAKIIRFQPTPDTTAEIRKAASGRIQPDGSFTLMTRKPADGVICGKYFVVFSVLSNPIDPSTSLVSKKYTGEEPSPFEPIVVDRDITDLEFLLEKK